MFSIAVAPIADPNNTRRAVEFAIICLTGDAGCSRSTPNEQAINMNNARPRASIRYSGQWRLIASAALLLD
jgi:hypothetical protein